MPSKFFKRAIKESSKSSKIFATKSVEIIVRIHDLLELQDKTQQELAKSLGKSPSEISKWMSPLHNLTLKSIAKLEAALGEDIVTVIETPKAVSIDFETNPPKKAYVSWNSSDDNKSISELSTLTASF